MNKELKNREEEEIRLEETLKTLLEKEVISEEEFDEQMALLKFSQEQRIMYDLLDDFTNFLVLEHEKTIFPTSEPKIYEKQYKDYESKKKHESQE